MHAKVIGLALAYISSAAASGFIEHSSEEAKFSNGTLIYYQPRDVEVDATLETRSCSNTGDAPVCSGDYAARNNICDQLINELNGDSATRVPKSPRQICYHGDVSGDSEYCCVSWHNVVPNLTKGDLAGPAGAIEAQCTSNGISGYIKNIFVHSTCTKVCLSSRGTHC